MACYDPSLGPRERLAALPPHSALWVSRDGETLEQAVTVGVGCVGVTTRRDYLRALDLSTVDLELVTVDESVDGWQVWSSYVDAVIGLDMLVSDPGAERAAREWRRD